MRTRLDIDDKLKNLQMNQETYEYRSEIKKLIYEINHLLDSYGLPRMPFVTMRVTEDDTKLLGRALVKGDVIWITKRTILDKNLRAVVYHELLHAVYGINHQSGDPLMDMFYKDIPKDVCQERFLYWIKTL
jgi:hypothetical protein